MKPEETFQTPGPRALGPSSKSKRRRPQKRDSGGTSQPPHPRRPEWTFHESRPGGGGRVRSRGARRDLASVFLRVRDGYRGSSSKRQKETQGDK